MISEKIIEAVIEAAEFNPNVRAALYRVIDARLVEVGLCEVKQQEAVNATGETAIGE